jgi:hypothetical protein
MKLFFSLFLIHSILMGFMKFFLTRSSNLIPWQITRTGGRFQIGEALYCGHARGTLKD